MGSLAGVPANPVLCPSPFEDDSSLCLFYRLDSHALTYGEDFDGVDESRQDGPPPPDAQAIPEAAHIIRADELSKGIHSDSFGKLAVDALRFGVDLIDHQGERRAAE